MNFRSLEDLTQEKLKDKEFLSAFIETAFEEFEQDNDLSAFLLSLQSVVKAKGGITNLAKETGLNREHLYKVFGNKVNPNFITLVKIMKYCGLSFKVCAT